MMAQKLFSLLVGGYVNLFSVKKRVFTCQITMNRNYPKDPDKRFTHTLQVNTNGSEWQTKTTLLTWIHLLQSVCVYKRSVRFWPLRDHNITSSVIETAK